MKKVLIGLLLFSVGAFADFKTISVDELIKMQKDGVQVIDIRTPAEWKQTGIIKGAHKMMFFTPKGDADVANWFFELGHFIKDKKQPFSIPPLSS